MNYGLNLKEPPVADQMHEEPFEHNRERLPQNSINEIQGSFRDFQGCPI